MPESFQPGTSSLQSYPSKGVTMLHDASHVVFLTFFESLKGLLFTDGSFRISTIFFCWWLVVMTANWKGYGTIEGARGSIIVVSSSWLRRVCIQSLAPWILRSSLAVLRTAVYDYQVGLLAASMSGMFFFPASRLSAKKPGENSRTINVHHPMLKKAVAAVQL